MNERWSVAITVRNDRDNMRDLLDSLARQTVKPGELVIVDALSTDGTWELVQDFTRSAPFPVRAVQEAGTRGAGRSACVRLATGRYVVFIDSDCVVPPDWLAKFQAGWAEEAARDAKPLGALGAPNHPPGDASELQRAIGDVMDHTEAASFHGVNTINCVYLRDAAIEAGLFDERLHTAEDPDLNARIARKGYRLTRTDNPCIHKRRDTWRRLVRQHYEYGIGGWMLIRRYPEYFPFVEGWVAPTLVVASLAGLALAALASPWFLVVPLLALVAFPLAVHRRMAWRFLLRYGPGPRWWRRLAVLWVVYLPYHLGILVARLREARGAREPPQPASGS